MTGLSLGPDPGVLIGAEQHRWPAEVRPHVGAAGRQPESSHWLIDRPPGSKLDADGSTANGAPRLDPSVDGQGRRDAESVEGTPRSEVVAVDLEPVRAFAERETGRTQHPPGDVAIDPAFPGQSVEERLDTRLVSADERSQHARRDRCPVPEQEPEGELSQLDRTLVAPFEKNRARFLAAVVAAAARRIADWSPPATPSTALGVLARASRKRAGHDLVATSNASSTVSTKVPA